MYSHKKHYFDESLDFANAINHTFLKFIILVQRDKETKTCKYYTYIRRFNVKKVILWHLKPFQYMLHNNKQLKKHI